MRRAVGGCWHEDTGGFATNTRVGCGLRAEAHTDQDVEDEGDDPGRRHAEQSLPAVPPAVDKHQTHVLEVAHGSGEELHQGVGQAVAGQHFDGILFDCGYAPVEGLEQKDIRGWVRWGGGEVSGE